MVPENIKNREKVLELIKRVEFRHCRATESIMCTITLDTPKAAQVRGCVVIHPFHELRFNSGTPKDEAYNLALGHLAATYEKFHDARHRLGLD